MREIVEKLCKIQSELRVPKNQKNKYGNYNFRNCDDIVEAVKPLLNREGLVLLMSDSLEEVNNSTYVKATVTLMSDCDKLEVSAYAREMPFPPEKGIMTEPMLTGSSSSYARKYALNGLFALDDAKDPDDNIQTEAPKEKIVKPSAKQINIITKQLSPLQLSQVLAERGLSSLEELDQDYASEIVAKIFKGGF